MSERYYTSATQRLSTVPEVFTGSDLTVLFGWKSAVASTYLALWRKAGLVKSLGGRSDVHMNLVQNRHVSTEQALRRAYPRAIKLGVDVLRQAGWMTQIPSSVDVAIPKSSSLHHIEGFNLKQRSDTWFERVAAGVSKVSIGVNQLQPAWALADMVARAQDRRVADAWLPDPDDLDMDAVFADRALPVATLALDAALSEPDDYEAIYTAWFESRLHRGQAKQGKEQR